MKVAQPLQAGSYKVNWQAVSADTHKVKGSFIFEVRPLAVPVLPWRDTARCMRFRSISSVTAPKG